MSVTSSGDRLNLERSSAIAPVTCGVAKDVSSSNWLSIFIIPVAKTLTLGPIALRVEPSFHTVSGWVVRECASDMAKTLHTETTPDTQAGGYTAVDAGSVEASSEIFPPVNA